MRYDKSREELKRVSKIIPLASQTFSKASNRWPAQAPHFLTHGKGGRVWDVDGNAYVDLVCGLLPVVLGYCDPDVDNAIEEQLTRGISFSLPTLLEADLADRLIEFVPCAEMVRFGKSGTDATSAAVRLARAVTGRDHIVMCGYHGWQDWSIGQADNVENRAGVPQPVRQLTTQIRPGDNPIGPQFTAAVIVDCSKIDAAIAQKYRDWCDSYGIILIFDEVISGFRYNIGGAQAEWGVKPDLACFSKAMGNGMPISAVVGRADLMKNFDHVFFSGTFGGETLSLAAALACVEKIEREDVCTDLMLKGAMLKNAFGSSKNVWLSGHPSHQQLNFASEHIRTAYITNMLQHGVLLNTALNLCHAHTMSDLDHVCEAHHAALEQLKLVA